MIKHKLKTYYATYQLMIIFMISLIGCSFLFMLIAKKYLDYDAYLTYFNALNMNYISGFFAQQGAIKSYFFVSLFFILCLFFNAFHTMGFLLNSLLFFIKYFSDFLCISLASYDLYYILFVAFELFFETVLYILIFICTFEISANVAMTTFFETSKLNIYKVLNHFLNYVIIILIFHCLHVLFIIYLL